MYGLIHLFFALWFSLQFTNSQSYDRVKEDFVHARQMAEQGGMSQALADSLSKKLVDELLPHWYGTPWDFNGTSDVPGQGLIACGYFVSTTLKHAGFPLNRYRMAQQAAAPVMRKLVPSDQIKTFRGISLEALDKHLSDWGFGLYMVGLDNHVGYLWNDGQQNWFIHASYGSPAEVVKEKLTESEVLSWSNLFMIGRLNTTFLWKKWAKLERIEF